MRSYKVGPRLFFAALALLAIGTAAVLWLGHEVRTSGLPQRSGDAGVKGLGSPVEVRWDRWAVPHVTARSAGDAAAAQGWLHANDRFAQMELGRRAAAGRLSEILGERTLEIDRRFRTLRFARTADRLWHSAGPESRGLLEAYARGVNAWLEAREDDFPPTLRILGIEPEPWRPEDSLAFVLLMANDLSFWQGRPEEKRFRWLGAFGAAGVRDLVGPADLTISPVIETLAREAATEPRLSRSATVEDPSYGDDVLGSNNWAIGPGLSASGHPLVASDPHLALQLPGTWYQILLRAPGLEVAGMSLPGLPAVVIGRGAEVAWALTNTMLDDHDLFFERLDPSGEKVLRDEAWIEIADERQIIGVKGGGDVEILLRETDRGPLLESDEEKGLPARSLSWTLYESAGADPLAAFIHLSRSRTVTEALEGLDPYIGPAQNLVMADRGGGLAFTVLGRLPERRRGGGRMPSPGWDPAFGWSGLLPRDRLPITLGAADDFLVTANNDIRPEGWAGSMSADFDTPHRARRIRQLLRSRREWREPGELVEIQNDIRSLYASEIVGELGGERFSGEAALARDILSGWEGEMDGTPEAALFGLFERELGRAIFGDEAEEAGLKPFSGRARLLRALGGVMSLPWLDDVRTEEIEDRSATVSAALERAWLRARELWGGDASVWSWRRAHPLKLTHPLGGLPMIGGWFDRGPFPMAGSATTVAAFGGRWSEKEQRVTYGPSMRWVTDTGDGDSTRAVLPGGQSGHPFDPHYDDQLALYLAGEAHAVAWSEEAIEEATVARLTLNPQAP